MKIPDPPMYDETSSVVKLTDATFDEKVLNSKEPWVVEFYAPWCGKCFQGVHTLRYRLILLLFVSFKVIVRN